MWLYINNALYIHMYNLTQEDQFMSNLFISYYSVNYTGTYVISMDMTYKFNKYCHKGKT